MTPSHEPVTKHAAGDADAPMHNIEGAFYSGGPGEPYFQPAMQCSCGWSVRDETWTDVGAAYDAHLAG